ncbi:MAG: hypothetical protein ACOC2U_03770 [bacterium]
MTFVTRPNLDDRQFRQTQDSELNLSGETNFGGILKSKGIEIDADSSGATSGFTLTFIGDNKIKLVETPRSDSNFDSNRPTTRSGIPSVNVGGETVVEFLEEYFFPSVPPSSTITASDSNREFGDDSSSTLSWSVTRETNPIETIELDTTGDGSYDVNITPTGESEDGTESASFTSSEHSPSQGSTQTTITYRIRVESTTNEVDNSSTQIKWRHKKYWFSNSNSFNSGDASTIESEMLANNSQLSTSRSKILSNYTLNEEYFYYAYPKHFGEATYTVNGFKDTSWGNPDENTLFEISFENSNGYVEDYYVAKSSSALTGDFTIEIS